MPELPEVETIVRDLSKSGIVGQRISSVKVFNKSSIKDLNFSKKLLNNKILCISRRAKYIIFHLEKFYLIVHLKMTGHLFLKEKNAVIEKHEHVHIFLGNKKIVFYDPRKFGKIYLTDDLTKFFKKIGPEPLDKNFSFEEFKKRISSKKRVIKTLLLDQSFIAGIGNIYANEILFLSKIHPLRKSDTLSSKGIFLLFSNIKEVLIKAIKNRGTTLGKNRSNFSSIKKNMGKNQNFLLVHQKENEPCPICKTKIIKLTIAQRSSFICPKCQKY